MQLPHRIACALLIALQAFAGPARNEVTAEATSAVAEPTIELAAAATTGEAYEVAVAGTFAMLTGVHGSLAPESLITAGETPLTRNLGMRYRPSQVAAPASLTTELSGLRAW